MAMATELLASVDILKKIEAKEAELKKVTDKLSAEITDLVMELPPSVRSAMLGRDYQDACDQLGCLNIYHVYGSLGSLSKGDRNFYEFGSPNDPEFAGMGIKIIGENDHEPSKEVAKRLGDCKHIFIMGCHYHKENVKIILEALPDSCSVFGTTYGIEPEERQTLQHRYSPRINFYDNAFNCLAALRKSKQFQEIIRDL